MAFFRSGRLMVRTRVSPRRPLLKKPAHGGDGRQSGEPQLPSPPMGFNPFREQERSVVDIVMVVLAVLATLAVIAWALFA